MQVKNDKNIKGVLIKDTEYTFLGNMQMIPFLLDGSEESRKQCLYILKQFENLSGLKVNVEKTKAVWLGVKRGCAVNLLLDNKMDWIHDGRVKFTLLGIMFTADSVETTSINYEEKTQSVEQLLENWSFRN